MQNLSSNLRLLCSYRPSISRVAQDLKINRSQFNRYLAGTSFPRGAMLRRICDYFGVEPHEILMPEDEFAQIVKRRGLASSSFMQTLRQHVDLIFNRNDPRITNLVGFFSSTTTQCPHEDRLLGPWLLLHRMATTSTTGVLSAWGHLIVSANDTIAIKAPR